jgi:hypothetical protein
VTAGRPGRADLVALQLDATGQNFTLRYESWGSGMFESPPVAMPSGRAGTFRIRLGSLLELPAHSPLDVLRDTLVVWVDGRPVWWRRLPAPIGAHPPLNVAGNPIGSNTATRIFRGRIDTWDRLPAPAGWKPGPFADLSVRLLDRGTGPEPLLATGVAGAANTLAIEWLPEGRARLVYDHWGYGVYKSPEFAWAPGGEHALDIAWPAFAQLDAAKNPPIQHGRLGVRLDGRELWAEEVPFYVADSATVVVGKNTAGSSVAGPALSSIVVDLRQQPLPGAARAVP